jgi:ribosomal protein L6P/L9E
MLVERLFFLFVRKEMFKKIKLPCNVRIQLFENTLKISNSQEEYFVKFFPLFKVQVKKGFIFLYFKLEYYFIKQKQKHFQNISLLFIVTTKLKHLLLGCSVGFFLQLVLKGVGYKVAFFSFSYVIFLKVGFSHPINKNVPKGIQVLCYKETVIFLKSSSKTLLGNFALKMKHLKKPDVYKNKGILLKQEIPFKKKIRKK